MGEVLIKVAAFVAIICAGYVAGRSGALGSGTGTMVSKIVFNLTLPCAVINAFGRAEFSRDLLWLIPVAIAFTVGSYFFMLPFTRRSDRCDQIFYLCNISGYNIGCFALPFVQAFFPPAQAVAICLFDAGNAFMMAGGIYALTSVIAPHDTKPVEHPVRLMIKRLFSSVTIDVYVVLIIMALAGLRVPEAIIQFTQPMTNANGFLAMLMLGLMTSLSVDARQLGKVARLLSLRLILNVVFTLIVVFLLPFDPLVRAVVCMGVWAPAGSMGPVFTLWCKGDHGLAGFANAITVVVAIVAMTFIVSQTAVMG